MLRILKVFIPLAFTLLAYPVIGRTIPLAVADTEDAAQTLSIDWSSDDKWVATTHLDNRIRVWNATTGLLERSVEVIPPSDFVSDPPLPLPFNIEWSPDGNHLAFIIRDGEFAVIRILDAYTFELILEIRNDETLLDWSQDIEWSPDGHSIAGTTTYGTGPFGEYFVKIWDVESGALRGELQTRSMIHQVEWNPDVERQQIAMRGGTLAQIWNVNTDEVFALITDENAESAITSVSWNSEGSLLATRDFIVIHIWDAETGQSVNQIYQGTANSTDDVMWMPNSDHFINIGLEDGVDVIYTLNATGSRTSEGVRLPNSAFDVNSTGERVVVSPDSDSIAIYDIASGQMIPFVTPDGE